MQNLELAQSLEDVKMEEILHFNLGLVNEKMKQPLQAIVHYTVVSAGNPTLNSFLCIFKNNNRELPHFVSLVLSLMSLHSFAVVI